MTPSHRDPYIAEQIKHMSAWKALMLTWYVLHFVLGVCAIALSVTVASKPAFIADSQTVSLLSWLLAIVTGFVTFLGPADRAGRYQRAYRVLLTEVTRFRTDQTYTVNHVLAAYNQGEEIIHGSKSR
ncbi:hypothetical protein [Ralstonia solanacearum]|uniref:hypothetical protein n=1 Tax=Ralstonia solanacearum TaxID=305 RepID=UPI001E60B548|nr:hypothetical protein [Ralstonia solanacearum]MDB0511935.1 hypothetical protein [Ralstonia solanacearum]